MCHNVQVQTGTGFTYHCTDAWTHLAFTAVQGMHPAGTPAYWAQAHNTISGNSSTPCGVKPAYSYSKTTSACHY